MLALTGPALAKADTSAGGIAFLVLAGLVVLVLILKDQ